MCSSKEEGWFWLRSITWSISIPFIPSSHWSKNLLGLICSNERWEHNIGKIQLVGFAYSFLPNSLFKMTLPINCGPNSGDILDCLQYLWPIAILFTNSNILSASWCGYRLYSFNTNFDIIGNNSEHEHICLETFEIENESCVLFLRVHRKCALKYMC